MSQDEGKTSRRKVLAASMCAIGGVGAGALGTVLVGSLRPTGSPLQNARQVIDISTLAPGEFIQFSLFDRPVLLLRRTQEQLRDIETVESDLADPASLASLQPDFAKNRHRSKRPELLIVQPVCTHLGCTVNYYPADHTGMKDSQQQWRGGFYCPCHSAVFDAAGRVRKGMPAPLNLPVPKHKFLSDTEVQFGHPDDPL